MKKLVIVLVLIAAAAVAFWFFNPAKAKDVETVSPVNAPAVQAVYATGTVEASRMIPISPKIGARLMRLDVDEGSRVEAGQVLAQLEDADTQENLKDLQAKLDLASKDLARAQKLSKSGAIAKEALDQASAAYKSASASVDRTKAELSYLQLIAPEAGTIIRRDGEIGEMIALGTPVFWITGGDDLRIETEVDEEDIGLVQPNQKVVISADAFTQKTFEGTVQSITPKGDPVARSYRVRVTLGADTPLMIGMTAETNIITQEKDSALMIPATAISQGKVLKIGGGKATDTPVKIGIKTPQAVEILEGVRPEDKIALKYDGGLLEEGHIKAKQKDWTPTSIKTTGP